MARARTRCPSLLLRAHAHRQAPTLPSTRWLRAILAAQQHRGGWSSLDQPAGSLTATARPTVMPGPACAAAGACLYRKGHRTLVALSHKESEAVGQIVPAYRPGVALHPSCLGSHLESVFCHRVQRPRATDTLFL